MAEALEKIFMDLKEVESFLLDSIDFLKEKPDKVWYLLMDMYWMGYEDKPDFDEEGKPILRRTTPLHLLARGELPVPQFTATVVPMLFRIYNKFDLNYIDEFGLTHFHVACRYGCADVVQKFLDFGQDPNLLVREIDDSPLLLALNWRHEEVAELLLRRGTDLNLRNAEGSTPLHIICHRYRDDYSAELLFKINKELHRPVQLDVADNYGRTPLQLAVANILPNTVDVLLSNGADLSSFVFPADSYFCEEVKPPEHGIRIKFELRLASGALLIVESLEKSGYELDRSDALTIMKFFAKRGLFEKSSDLEKHWYDDGEFVEKAKKIMVKPGLSLHDLTRLPPKEAKKQITIKEYFDFSISLEFNGKHKEACLVHLCEKLSRDFFLFWSMDPFMELTHYRLPLICCDKIFEHLNNEDLFNICMAATRESS